MLNAPSEAPLIEGDELYAVSGSREVERVSEVEAVAVEIDSLQDLLSALELNVWKSREVLNNRSEVVRAEAVEGADDPLQLEDHRDRNEQAFRIGDDPPRQRPLANGLQVSRVLDIEASEDVGVDRDHGS